MKTLSICRLVAGLLLGLVAYGTASAQTETYPPVKLRGYGTLAGTFTSQQIDGQPASVLKINCDDVDKAKLVQAKYLSDLQLLPGTKPGSLTLAGTTIPDYEIDQQGAILAARDDTTVYVLAGASPDTLAKLAAQTFPDGAKQRVFSPEVTVPMYLDRWDKFGFRSGDRPLEAPKGKNFDTYDVNQEFDWLVKMDKMGLVLWNWTDSTDTAEGFVMDHFWDWSYPEVKDRNLTLELNLATTFYHGTQLWLSNRYPDEMSQRMPGYVGSAYSPVDAEGGQGYVSWNSGIGLDIQLAELQQTVRKYVNEPNVVGYQEPHSELRHFASDMLLEYGKVADGSFRDWLRNKYQTVAAVAQRWGVAPGTFQSWDDIHVPELASFLGWGPDAFDLGGPWRISYSDITVVNNQPIAFPAGPFAADFDDSGWPEATIPGDDHAMFLPKKPAVFRRTFELPEAWIQAHPKVWLYLLDMNQAWGKNVQVSFNGQDLGPSVIRHYDPHADWYDVTSLLKPGTNQLAVGLPSGYLAYRVYLSGSEPHEYPDLGMGQNAHWADYVDWMDDSRVEGYKRGVEMIRQVDPNRDIYLAAPNHGVSGLTSLAQEYGCDFHNTGSMSGSWGDYLPSLMAGAGLPMSLEPGSGIQNASDVDSFLGHWATEGLQSIDYIQDVREIYLPDDIRQKFEAHLNDWHLFGKYHVPDAEWATLYSSRVDNLKLFPWGKDPNLLLHNGSPLWEWISDIYPHAGITDTQLIADQANRYKVIIDSNTSIMDADLVDAIERYVRQGGIFVTFVQTGRHTSIQKDAWPISQLTGYSVTAIDPLDDKGNAQTRGLHLVPGEDVFPPADWSDPKAFTGGNGLSLKKEAPECRDLMQWDDGTVAAGIRPLGKGFIIDLGVKFSNNVIWSGNRDATDHLFNDILQWAKLKREPAQLDNLAAANTPNPTTSDFDIYHRPGDIVKFRHYISNNGLYDVWAIWNMKPDPVSGSIHFTDISPGSAVEVRTGNPYPIDARADGSQELKFQLDGNETENFLTPRKQIAAASQGWFALQRSWWQGTAVPPAKTLPSLDSIRKLTVALDGPWAVKSLDAGDDPLALSSPNVDDSGWDHHEANLALLPLPAPTDPPRRILLRRHFTVPATWTNGEISLWIKSPFFATLRDQGTIYCDGQLIREMGDAVVEGTFDGLFKPGSTHLLALEIESKGCYLGTNGNIWLSYLPNPVDSVDLTGDWETSADALSFDGKTTLPGPWQTWMARRHFTLDPSHQGQSVFLRLQGTNVLNGAIINGRYVAGHPFVGETYDLNITNWVHFGQDNQIELVGNQGDIKNHSNTLNTIALNFYAPGTY